MGIRVAAYGRVPSNRDVLLKQKAVMIQRFSEIIRQHDDWSYRGAFIDSGTGHDQWDDLLGRCREGGIDTIITPSMNTLSLRRDELYRTLSELKALGVGIDFLEEELSTMGESGDELLSTLASFLNPVKPPKPIELPYGIGDEDEAAVVKRAFDLFLSGHGRVPIARKLNDGQIPPPRLDIKVDCSAWTYCDVKRILENPIYAEKGLIDGEIWERTVAEAARRRSAYGLRAPADSPLAGLITCGVCGNHYTRRERGRSSLWLCKTYMKKGREVCPSRCIREDRLFSIINDTAGSDVDNITIWPDGCLTIDTPTGGYQRNWR